MGNSAPPQPHLRIHAINIYVRDQDRSLRFYLDQLGFNLAFDAKFGSGGRWGGVAPPDGTAGLMLIAPQPGPQEHKLIGRATPGATAGFVLVIRRACGASSMSGLPTCHPHSPRNRRQSGAPCSPASKTRMGTLSRWWASTK